MIYNLVKLAIRNLKINFLITFNSHLYNQPRVSSRLTLTIACKTDFLYSVELVLQAEESGYLPSPS